MSKQTIHDIYHLESKWFIKATLIEIYHLERKKENPAWKLEDTCNYFGISLGLCSEGLKIARALRENPALMRQCESREAVLKKIK